MLRAGRADSVLAPPKNEGYVEKNDCCKCYFEHRLPPCILLLFLWYQTAGLLSRPRTYPLREYFLALLLGRHKQRNRSASARSAQLYQSRHQKSSSFKRGCPEGKFSPSRATTPLERQPLSSDIPSRATSPLERQPLSIPAGDYPESPSGKLARESFLDPLFLSPFTCPA